MQPSRTLPSEAITEYAYITGDLEQSVQRWTESVKAGPFFRSETPPGLDSLYRGQPCHGTAAFCMGFLGTTLIEIVQPTNDLPSVFREGFDGSERLHHILPRMKALTPAEFDAISDNYARQGFEQVFLIDAPMFGRAAFFDARAKMGVFLELVECLPPTLEIIERAWKIHAGWNGERPIRDFSELL